VPDRRQGDPGIAGHHADGRLQRLSHTRADHGGSQQAEGRTVQPAGQLAAAVTNQAEDKGRLAGQVAGGGREIQVKPGEESGQHADGRALRQPEYDDEDQGDVRAAPPRQRYPVHQHELQHHGDERQRRTDHRMPHVSLPRPGPTGSV
jgi:hypothetical protein